MSQPIIKIENLSKLYRLGEVGTGTLSHDLNRWWKTKVLRREDPYTKIGSVNDRTQAAQKGEHVWALRDINLELQEGDVLGIIGKNGAGKSTLLKLLSQVTSPTTGRIRARGRMASLLEVGTGFHPEMTGRENIYMNGTIMGMRKKEITSKLDEIVEFSGIAKYLDTPVKRYSSGMTVRLGFAIAAHLEPEILVVDEVLAVGDAEFQKKAIGKMQDVSKSHGRTVLFVSHNMAAVKALCKSGMVLVNGSQRFEGNINDAIDFYQENNALVLAENNHWEFGNNAENDNIRVTSIKITPLNGTTLDISSGVQIEIDFYNKIKDITEDLTFEIVTKEDILVFHHGVVFAKDRDSKLGKHKITAVIPPDVLNANTYSMNLIFGQSQRYVLFSKERICAFEVENVAIGNNMSVMPGVVRPNITYTVNRNDQK
ncbi:MAG: ABC transporter ATP-binding protein [Methylococcales bacterium]|nr:ABC transporter ATP-binding protein [Methylococcales bacterium]